MSKVKCSRIECNFNSDGKCQSESINRIKQDYEDSNGEKYEYLLCKERR